jgi:hypothetical protein
MTKADIHALEFRALMAGGRKKLSKQEPIEAACHPMLRYFVI